MGQVRIISLAFRFPQRLVHILDVADMRVRSVNGRKHTSNCWPRRIIPIMEFLICNSRYFKYGDLYINLKVRRPARTSRFRLGLFWIKLAATSIVINYIGSYKIPTLSIPSNNYNTWLASFSHHEG